MARIRPPYFITAQMIAELMDVEIRYASDRLTLIRRTLNKSHGAYVSLAEYARFEGTSLADLEDYFIRTRGNTYIPPGQKEPEKEKKVDKVK